jgi:hypothetical protein
LIETNGLIQTTAEFAAEQNIRPAIDLGQMPLIRLLIVIAGLSQRVDRIRTGCDGECNSDGASSLQELAPFILKQFVRDQLGKSIDGDSNRPGA